MRTLWWQRFFHWAMYLTLVGYLPAFGFMCFLFHHLPHCSTIVLSVIMLTMTSAQQARKEVRGKKSIAPKPGQPAV